MERIEVSVQRPRCPFCHDDVAPSDRKLACDACMGWHHTECWRARGACAACGHARTSDGLSPGTTPSVSPAVTPARSQALGGGPRRQTSSFANSKGVGYGLSALIVTVAVLNLLLRWATGQP